MADQIEIVPLSEADAEQPTAPGGRPRLPWVVAGIAAAVAVAAVGVAILFVSWWAPLHTEARDRETVQTLGSEFAVHLTSFEGERIDEWVEETRGWATGTYAEQLDRLFDQELREALRDAEVVSVGTLLNLFVQDADDGEATVFAVIRQTVDNRFTEEPFEDELRMEIVFQQMEDTWLVGDVAVLGPPGPLGVPAPVEEGISP
jgi:hypothetical protein